MKVTFFLIVLFYLRRSVREGFAHVRRTETKEKEDIHEKKHPESHL